MYQGFVNMPAEIRNSRRFFKVGKDKRPLTKDWSNPEVQIAWSEIEGIYDGNYLAGFDTCGHGVKDEHGKIATDYLFLDFDHVLFDGNFVNEDVRAFVLNLRKEFPKIYIETSISGTGLHVFLIPTPAKFPALSNGKGGVLYFSDSRTKDSPKLEIFYGSGGRYCLVTGNTFYLDENEKNASWGSFTDIPDGSNVDFWFTNLLNEIKLQNALSAQSARKNENNSSIRNNLSNFYDDPPQYRHDLILACLDAAPPQSLPNDSDWLAVITACKNEGVDYAIVDNWCRLDLDRYDEKENRVRWNSVTDTSYDINVLIGKAQANGFNATDFKRQWYKDNPQFSNTTRHFDSDDPLAFLNPAARADFLNLQLSPPSKNRDKAIVDIIKDNLDKNHKGKILATALNLRKACTVDPKISGLFAFEGFKEEVVFIKQPFWDKSPRINSQLTDTDDAALRVYLRENYSDNFNRLATDDLFSVIAKANSFNVVQDYFYNLPQWDGTPRADSLFIDFLGVDDTPFARAVTSNWLLAAVARIFHAGCKFQTALVLQGAQHIGKTFLAQKLGGNWYGNLTSKVDDSHALDELRRFWICEIQEMSAMRKADVNAQKAFIERNADTYRAAYARRAQSFNRHCVFIITVNDEEFLRDLTGNRRYLILKCNNRQFEIKQELTDEHIQQVWAEMFQRFKSLTANGFKDSLLELPLEFKIQAETIAADFTVDDGLQGEIAAFLDIRIPAPVVWKLFTKDEKRKFFLKNSITFEEADFGRRVENYLTADEQQQYKLWFDEDKHHHIQEAPRPQNTSIMEIEIYGAVLRQETCAAEIYNEFFSGGDKRKLIHRINEIMPKLEDWKSIYKDTKDFNGYGHQRKIYRRVAVETADSTTNTEIPDVPLPF